jgi:hypothetical protein
VLLDAPDESRITLTRRGWLLEHPLKKAFYSKNSPEFGHPRQGVPLAQDNVQQNLASVKIEQTGGVPLTSFCKQAFVSNGSNL